MNLKKFRITAAAGKKSLGVFLDRLDMLVPEDLPVVVAKIDAAVWQKVDCTTCANCCKTMTPTYKKSDVLRISAFLAITPQEFVSRWLHKEEETGDWVNNTQPCQFLVDNKCSVYDVRPKDCAQFPHHNSVPFDDYNETFKNNLALCPATYLLVNKLKKIVERDYEWD